MRKLRYWYKAIPPTRLTVTKAGTGTFEVSKGGKLLGIIGESEAKRLTSWRIEAVVWEEKHGA